jgi:tetratricopeptide (TPR) repeat protein
MFYCNYSREVIWVERARNASGKAVALRWDLREVQVSQAWVLYATELRDESVCMVRKAIERKKDCEGAYYPLYRALFSAGRYQEVVDVMDAALEVGGEDYNVYVPIANDLGAKRTNTAICCSGGLWPWKITSNRCRKMLEQGSCWPRIMRNSIEWKRPSRN